MLENAKQKKIHVVPHIVHNHITSKVPISDENLNAYIILICYQLALDVKIRGSVFEMLKTEIGLAQQRLRCQVEICNC